jgi:hypothetical protein
MIPGVTLSSCTHCMTLYLLAKYLLVDGIGTGSDAEGSDYGE